MRFWVKWSQPTSPMWRSNLSRRLLSSSRSRNTMISSSLCVGDLSMLLRCLLGEGLFEWCCDRWHTEQWTVFGDWRAISLVIDRRLGDLDDDNWRVAAGVLESFKALSRLLRTSTSFLKKSLSFSIFFTCASIFAVKLKPFLAVLFRVVLLDRFPLIASSSVTSSFSFDKNQKERSNFQKNVCMQWAWPDRSERRGIL